MASHIVLTIIDIIIVIVAVFLIVIYSTNKKFRSFPCYFNIFFSLVIMFDNLIRLIPGGEGTDIDTDDKSIPCLIQAFTLSTFDKLMLALMTSYSIINYLGFLKLRFYKKNEKSIFIILSVISLIISISLTIIFFKAGTSNRSEFCYVETNAELKKIVDTIATIIMFIISLFCIIKVLVNIRNLKKERNDIEEIKTLNYHFYRFIVDLIITSLTFLYVILLILKALPFKGFAKDLIFILLCLIIELFFTINKELFRELKLIITCTKQKNETDDDNPRNSNVNESLSVDGDI